MITPKDIREAREHLRFKVDCEVFNKKHADTIFSALDKLVSIRGLVTEMKKGHQGCVGFIEDDDRYNQAIEDVLKELGN